MEILYQMCLPSIWKKGLYLLSHFDSEHKHDYAPPTPVNEGNLASVDVPMGIPAATTRDPTTVPLDHDDDPIEFQGAWCTTVSNAQAAAAFAVTAVDDSDDDDDLVSDCMLTMNPLLQCFLTTKI